MTMKPTLDQFEIFQQIFTHFNKHLFNDSLPPVILNFSRKKNAAGFFAPERWQSKKQEKVHEISLNPMYMGQVTFERLCSTLVHEMAHLWQQIFGKPSRTGYHNKEWAEKMESIGLIPSETGEKGGKKTGQSMTHYISEKGLFKNAFRLLPSELAFPFMSQEQEIASKKSGGKPAPKNKVKYSCPRCKVNVWGKPDLEHTLFCKPCESYLEVEVNEEEAELDMDDE